MRGFRKSVVGLTAVGITVGVVLVGGATQASAAGPATVPAGPGCLLVLCEDNGGIDLDVDLDIDLDLDGSSDDGSGGGGDDPPPEPTNPGEVLGVDVDIAAVVDLPGVVEVDATVPAQVGVTTDGSSAGVAVATRPDVTAEVVPDLGGPGGPSLAAVVVDDLDVDTNVRIGPDSSGGVQDPSSLLGGLADVDLNDLTCGLDLLQVGAAAMAACTANAVAGIDGGLVGLDVGVDVCDLQLVVLGVLDDADCGDDGPATEDPGDDPGDENPVDDDPVDDPGDDDSEDDDASDGGGSTGGNGPQGIISSQRTDGSLPVTGASLAVLMTLAAAALAAGVMLQVGRRSGAADADEGSIS